MWDFNLGRESSGCFGVLLTIGVESAGAMVGGCAGVEIYTVLLYIFLWPRLARRGSVGSDFYEGRFYVIHARSRLSGFINKIYIVNSNLSFH